MFVSLYRGLSPHPGGSDSNLDYDTCYPSWFYQPFQEIARRVIENVSLFLLSSLTHDD
jgi:hypothetical protein